MNPIEYAEQCWKYANDLMYRPERTMYDILERTYNVANNFMTINQGVSNDEEHLKFCILAKEELRNIYNDLAKRELGIKKNFFDEK